MSQSLKAPLLSWDIFVTQYNVLLQHAEEYQHSAAAIKKIAKANNWNNSQTAEAISNIQQYVIVITDHQQLISFTGKGFTEMTGFSFEEARGQNPRFLQGNATNKKTIQLLKTQLNHTAPIETTVENYRKNGELYLCKIIIKPIISTENKLVNYIAYEQEVAA